MSHYIQFLQVNQNFQALTEYGGIAPLSNSKWWIGRANEDPRENPVEVFIIDVLGHKQVLSQPLYTDNRGNFIESQDSILGPALHPQIEQTEYSIYVEVVSDGHLAIYQRRSVPVSSPNATITREEFNTAIEELNKQIQRLKN